MAQEIRDTITFLDSADLETIVLNNENGNVSLRGNLIVFNGDAHALRFNPATSLLTVGANDNDGHLFLEDGSGHTTFNLDGKNAILVIGSMSKDGNLRIRDNADRTVFDFDGANAVLRVGALGNEGDIEVQDAMGRRVFHMDGEDAFLTIGTEANEGDIRVLDSAGNPAISADGGTAFLTVGTSGNEGDIVVRDANEVDRIHINSNRGHVVVRDGNGTTRILLDGDAGDIKIFGADCAEKFEVAELADPGAVMIINEHGKLRPSAGAYDRRVAGVVAGGGDLRPGIILGHTGNDDGLLPIALSGRTYCKVDAGFGAVGVGDLLTTSPTPGYAMKATDPQQAFGAVIGKAMRPLADGQGLIPILVALQ
jgi:hypothetical protein